MKRSITYTLYNTACGKRERIRHKKNGSSASRSEKKTFSTMYKFVLFLWHEHEHYFNSTFAPLLALQIAYIRTLNSPSHTAFSGSKSFALASSAFLPPAQEQSKQLHDQSANQQQKLQMWASRQFRKSGERLHSDLHTAQLLPHIHTNNQARKKLDDPPISPFCRAPPLTANVKLYFGSIYSSCYSGMNGSNCQRTNV